jgi:fructokinase
MRRPDYAFGVITVVGEALVDLIQRRGADTYHAEPGGSPYNVAIGLARLGIPVSLTAGAGPDQFGQRLRRHAEDNGVELSRWVASQRPTTLAIASVDECGQANYGFYLDATAGLDWRADDLVASMPDSGVLHVGSIASWYPPAGQAVLALQARAHGAGTCLISYDPNVRPALLGSPGAAAVIVEANVALAHVVKASAEDVEWLYPGVSVAQAAARWSLLGPALVIITSGGDGATAYAGGEQILARPAIPVSVVDTVGAGDAFTAGLLAALSDRGVTSAGRLSDGLRAGVLDLVAVLDYAITTSGLICERAGADPPTRAEVLTARTG